METNVSSTVIFSIYETSTPADDLWSKYHRYTVPEAVIITLVLLCVILGTLLGNILVCISVLLVRKLRRPSNYLLVSLAVSDLCVALLVMPMALVYEILGVWSFGPVLCDIWVSFDLLCCTASILNLCMISVDRYLAITKPLEYSIKRTPLRMMIYIAIVWIGAACICLPPIAILGNEHLDENGVSRCLVSQNFVYQVYATFGSFYIPLTVMLVLYYKVFRAAREIMIKDKRSASIVDPEECTVISVVGGRSYSTQAGGMRRINTASTIVTVSYKNFLFFLNIVMVMQQ
ncbi:5-hydroxytryptamine receptor 1-like [Anabrus simplex]|uniref:5-hydroxytryptamine receptor 1-like n=1 Tax=Anabrus simplex TaxID=316456 RepID=UPI0035A2A162